MENMSSIFIEKPKLAILDLGNVVFRVDWQPMFDIWSNATGVPIDDLKKRFLFDESYEDFERGHLSAREFHQGLCNMLSTQLTYSEFECGWNAIYQELFDGIALTLEQLRYEVRTVAFTNTNEVHYRVWSERYRDALANFEHVFVSSEMGVRKPEAESFEHVLSYCSVQPIDAVFFDDSLSNVEAAMALGIRSILVDSPNSLLTGLSDFGLIEEKR